MNKTSQALTLLKKVYHHTNTDYKTDYLGEVGYKTHELSESQRALLEEVNLVPNDFSRVTHDDLLTGFLVFKASNALNLDDCIRFFIKGLSGDYPRYRQTLMSYWYLSSLTPHAFEPSETTTNCGVCGLPESVTQDRTHNLFTYYLGHSWNEMPEQFLAELQEASQMDVPELLPEDITRLKALLLEINQAAPNETPGQLEKRIAKSKLLPKTDKYKRYGILQALAVVGVLPPSDNPATQPVRSDIALPLADWKGEQGVDFAMVKVVFGLDIESECSEK